MSFAANCPVSMPVYLPNVVPDVDLNGMVFSYKYGLMYALTGKPSPPLTPPQDA